MKTISAISSFSLSLVLMHLLFGLTVSMVIGGAIGAILITTLFD